MQVEFELGVDEELLVPEGTGEVLVAGGELGSSAKAAEAVILISRAAIRHIGTNLLLIDASRKGYRD